MADRHCNRKECVDNSCRGYGCGCRCHDAVNSRHLRHWATKNADALRRIRELVFDLAEQNEEKMFLVKATLINAGFGPDPALNDYDEISEEV